MELNTFVNTKYGRGELIEIVPTGELPKGKYWKGGIKAKKPKDSESYIVKIDKWQVTASGIEELSKSVYKWASSREVVLL